MKEKRFLFVMAAFCCFLLVSGCQTMPVNSGAVSVAPEDQIPVAQGQKEGVWVGRDLSIEYKFSRGGSLDISGTVQFADHMRIGYLVLNDFRLRVIFLDASGRVLGSGMLATDRGDFREIRFNRRLSIPASTSSIAFGYEGKAIEGAEDGGTTTFWHNTVY